MISRPPPRLEVGTILRQFGERYLKATSGHGFPGQEKVVRRLAACRTAALGGTRYRCRSCGKESVVYRSCRDRHCPKCQAAARFDWLAEQESHLLPVPYFHVVFTLPSALNELALRNQRKLYGWLFQAASRTLLEIGRDPRHLGVELGFLAVLHTWGQNLQLHPHVHCVVPGGGFTPEGGWRTCRANFLLPVRVLSRVFRGKYLELLRHALRDGTLDLPPSLERHRDREQLLDEIAAKKWVVYAKPPFGGPTQVLKYLARYTHRVAISNQRLVKLEGERVTFRWKDRRQDDRQTRTMTLDVDEFLRRFLLHLLPSRFHRIRHYGFLANRVREERLEQARSALGVTLSIDSPRSPVEPERDPGANDPSLPPACPHCGSKELDVLGTEDPELPETTDSS